MSALPPKADMRGAQAYVRLGPEADISSARLKGSLIPTSRHSQCANASGSVNLNYWRGGRPSKAGTPSAMRWKG